MTTIRGVAVAVAVALGSAAAAAGVRSSSSVVLRRSPFFHTAKPLLTNPSPIPGLRFVSSRRFSSGGGGGGGVQVSDSGSVDSPLMQSMETKIKEQLNAEAVTVKDAYGDGQHVSIDVVSAAFEGQSAVNRQRMVYKAIWEELQNKVHAVDQMTTRTPAEAAGSK